MELFKTVLNNIYDEFFNNLTEDPLFKPFFKNKDTEEIKSRQIEGILNLYYLFTSDNLNALKSQLIKLGKFHENLGIDYPVFLETINRLEILTVKELFKYRTGNVEEVFFYNTKFFELLKDYTALGYLKNLVSREKASTREFIEILLQEKAIQIEEIIDKHIHWEEDILDFIAENKKNIDVNIEETKCEIGQWFSAISKKNVNSTQIQKLKKLHREIHITAHTIIFLKENEKYNLLVNEYSSFVKNNLLFLSSLLTFLFSEKIHELEKDNLTKLLTRSVLNEIYPKVMELSILTGQKFGIAFVDIDNFKSINDKYGHNAGDVVLKNLAQIMKKSLRKSDYLFRYGGEEFVIIVNGTTKKAFYHLLEKIRKEIQQTKIRVDSKEISVTVSIGGIVLKSRRYIPLNELIDKADNLMYEAKKEGKNRVIVEELKV